MAVKAKDQVTLVDLTDAQSMTIYYLLEASTLSAPSQPVTLNPDGWSTIEPSFTDGTTNTLYTCVRTLFKNGDFEWGDVSISSSYEAAKSAYNQAIAVSNKLTSWCDDNDTTLINGAMVATGTLIARNVIAPGSIDTTCLNTGAVHANNIDSGAVTATKLYVDQALINAIIANSIDAQSINISCVDTGNTCKASIATEYDPGDQYNQFKIILQSQIPDPENPGFYVGSSNLTVDSTGIYINGDLGINVDSLDVTANSVNLSNASINMDSSTTYTTFDGGVLSAGSIVVAKKAGWCQIFGYLKPSAAVSSFTQVLAATKVPAPQHGANITPTVPSWASASDAPARVRVQGSGGLAIKGGLTNTEYNFSITYPIA